MPEEQMSNHQVVIHQLALMQTQIGGLSRDLAVNTTETKNIVARLDKLNGTVAEHQKEIMGLDHDRIQILSHISRLLEQQNELKKEQMAAEESEKNGDRRKSDVYKRILLALVKGIGVIVALLLYNLLVKGGIVAELLHLPI